LTTKTVSLAGLGLCEHCNILITIEDMPVEAMDAEWRCPNCEGILTGKSFGYEDGKTTKTRWVGKDKQWIKTKPEEDFELGNWFVIARKRLDIRVS